MRHATKPTALWALLVALLFSSLVSSFPSIEKRQDEPAEEEDMHWVGSWTSMPQLVEPHNMPPAPYSGGTTFRDATLRQTLFMSLTASRIRFQVSNTFGGAPLPVTSMTVSYPTDDQAGSPSIDTSALTSITFNGGESSVTVPQGEVVWSDPVDFEIEAQKNIAVSMYFAEGQQSSNVCGHPGSRTTSWMGNGDLTEADSINGASTKHWYFLTVVEAWMPTEAQSIIVLGDSITDGRGSEDDHNNRWPDLLATRMQEEGIDHLGMNNQAAGGNAVLQGGLGPTLLTRYQRDLLSMNNVKYMILFEGVNDIGGGGTDSGSQQRIGDGLISAFEQIASEAKEAGIITIGATIAPFAGQGQGYSHPTREQTRQRVNEWILTSGTFDYTVDFAKILADPNSPDRLASQYDGGDHLHPNVAGYQAIADNFPLEIFQENEADTEE